MTDQSIRVAKWFAGLTAAVGLGQRAVAFAPPTQADPPNQLTATIPLDYAQVHSYSQILSFDPSNPVVDYPKVYWFKYTADGNSVVKFDTLGSNFGSQGGGVVLGSHNQSQIAVYNAAGQLKGLGKNAQDLKGDPITIYPSYTLEPGNQNQNWYTPQGLTELYFRPNAPTNPHWAAAPNDPTPHKGWAAPGNEGNSQKYYQPYYPTNLNEYHVWSTSFSYVILDNNDQPVINPGTNQPYNQPGWRFYDRGRFGPGSPWSRYDVLPAGDYYIAVSSGLPVFQGDVSGEEILRAPISYNPDTQQIHQSILTAPMGTFQYYLDPTGTDQYGTIVLNVTSAPLPRNTQWAVNVGGNWQSSATVNWSNGVPNGLGDEALFGTFGGTITSPQNITIPSPVTAGALTFDNANSYTLSGATITLTALDYASVHVLQGSHTIAAPMVLPGNTEFTTAAGAGISVTGDMIGGNANIAKFGAGTAQFKNVRARVLDVQAGTVRVSAKATANDPGGASTLKVLTIAPGSSLDLTNNSIVIDYTGPVRTLVSDTRQLVQSGQLTSTLATATTGLGYADNAVLSPVKTTFAGQTVDPSSILVKFTYFGDSDLDGDVDVADLGNLATNWQAGVGTPLGPSFSEALASVGLPSVAVPEPAAAGLMLAAVALKCHRRRRPM
jgi:hypothetical protein